MKLKVLGSGSSGNCYVLQKEDEALIIEAGVPFLEVKKALDFNVRKIVGVVVSHSHGDHSKFVREYGQAGIPVFKPYNEEIVRPLSEKYGGFGIKAFRLVHDVPCYGFYIQHAEIGRLVYASDTEYIKYRFKELNHILVECNYSNDLIDREVVNREHVLRGHMELQTTLEFLRVNNNPELRNVILLHLSQNNAEPVEFVAAAEKVVQCPVWVAERGLEVDLRLVPF